VACCRWCGIGLGWSGALAGPPRDQLTGDEPMVQDYPAPPPELSPAAQAVLDAFRSSHTGQGCLAAALKAAADQLGEEMIVMGEGFKGVTRDELSIIHVEDLLTIAAELDGATTTSENV
jgi:hypothetical protein